MTMPKREGIQEKGIQRRYSGPEINTWKNWEAKKEPQWLRKVEAQMHLPF